MHKQASPDNANGVNNTHQSQAAVPNSDWIRVTPTLWHLGQRILVG